MMSKTEVVPWHGMREAPIVLVTGSESYLADRVFRELRDRVRIAQPELEVTDLDAANYAVGTLLDVASPSLFGEARMIRIANGESGGDEFVADIQSYLEVIADDVIVIVRHGGGNRGKKLLDTLRAHPTTLEVECAEIKKDADRAQFVAAEFNRLGAKADRAAVGALVEAFAGDLAELAAACDQIASDALGKPITKEFVDTYYQGREEVTSFAVADMAIDGNRAEALRLLRHAIQSGVDPVPLIAAFAAKLRQLAKVGGYTGSPSNAAKELGMPPWMIDKTRSALRKWTGPTLGKAILAVAEADSMVKGAGRDPEFAVERMVDRVASRT
ncbi:MAG: DNA polymerase III subunit delta [Microbacteriaceae bacterium]|nr:DNA polymerase III subunit delta [Microbacteriaceae bacterium]